MALTLDVSGIPGEEKAAKEGVSVVLRDGAGWFAPEPRKTMKPIPLIDYAGKKTKQ